MTTFRTASSTRVSGPGEERDARASERPPEMDDTVLIAQIRAGNPAVADLFCRRVWPQVDRTVRRLLGRDDGERDDLSQLAIIELVRAIGGYRGESALDTWVSAVTAHVVYKNIRRRPIGRHVSLDSIQESFLPQSRMDGEGAMVAREVLSRILDHLEGIGEKLSWTFVLHDVLGHGLRDVARIMSVSEAAAQSRLVRGRKQLHQRISEDPEIADYFGNLDGDR